MVLSHMPGCSGTSVLSYGLAANRFRCSRCIWLLYKTRCSHTSAVMRRLRRRAARRQRCSHTHGYSVKAVLSLRLVASGGSWHNAPRARRLKEGRCPRHRCGDGLCQRPSCGCGAARRISTALPSHGALLGAGFLRYWSLRNRPSVLLRSTLRLHRSRSLCARLRLSLRLRRSTHPGLR